MRTKHVVFEAISDPTRRAILDSLRVRDRAAGDIAALFPVSRPAISKHLWVLRAAGLLSVSNLEGGNGLNFATAADPRVPVIYAGLSRFDSKTPHFQFLPYDSFGSSIVNASGKEARLIEAEAALQASNIGTWLSKLNEVRALYLMAPLTDPGAAGRVDLMFRERAFTLFATAHRVGDLRRLVRQYSRTVAATFPAGAYHKDNLTRGNQGSIIVPQTEENNPNFKATDCDATKA